MTNQSAVFLTALLLTGVSYAADVKTPIVGYTNTPALPSGWRVHDIDRPQPIHVTPAVKQGGTPSDAIVLFDGTTGDEWLGSKQDNPKKGGYNPTGDMLWKLESDYLECTPTGNIQTKRVFGDCQLHVEWQTENPTKGDSQHRGNSGIFLMGRYEVQVLDCYNNLTYADGTAGCVYGQTPPMVNAVKKPGKWQSYDIIFQAPRFEGDILISPAYITVLLNGIIVQHKTEVLGPTSHKKLPVYSAHGKAPISLQDHNNATRFRNIWIRELDLLKNTYKTKSRLGFSVIQEDPSPSESRRSAGPDRSHLYLCNSPATDYPPFNFLPLLLS
jgi:hypothetical protein